jgi:ABC-type sulfate transport system permease component
LGHFKVLALLSFELLLPFELLLLLLLLLLPFEILFFGMHQQSVHGWATIVEVAQDRITMHNFKNITVAN